MSVMTGKDVKAEIYKCTVIYALAVILWQLNAILCLLSNNYHARMSYHVCLVYVYVCMFFCLLAR